MDRSTESLVTPALLLDLDRFEANLARLTDTLANRPCGFRPHAKTHKCPEIARRQIAAGANGVSVATVGEAEAMVAANVAGVLLTSPVIAAASVRRVANLAGHSDGVMAVVDHPRGVQAYSQAAAEVGVTLEILVDLDVGDHRTGVEPGPAAVDLARRVIAAEHLRFRGLQAYSGGSSHVNGYEARAKASREAMGRAVQTRRLLESEGIDVGILSGGSTGTYDIDSAIDGVTELQAGSFVVMDIGYRAIGGRDGDAYTDFQPALTVLSTVVSANHPDRVTLDAGTKAFSTETRHAPEPVDRAGLRYGLGGDEFGIVRVEGGARRPELGERIRFSVPHCDPTINLYDRMHCMRGDRVVDEWPIVARRSA